MDRRSYVGVPVHQSTDLADHTIATMASWYAGINQVPRVFRSLHPLLLREVQKRAGGNWRRCTVEPDGAVVIHNHVVWNASSD